VGKGRWPGAILLGVLAAATIAVLAVPLRRVFAPMQVAPAAQTVDPVSSNQVLYPPLVFGQRPPAQHGVLELVYRGAPGASAKVYWENGEAEVTNFPVTIDVPFGVVCVNARKLGQGRYHEDFEIAVKSPKKRALITLLEQAQPTAEALGFIAERDSREANRQPTFLETAYGGGDWGRPQPSIRVSVDVTGQLWRGEKHVGNVQPALLRQMLALRDAAALSPLSPGYTGCIDCGGRTLTLYRSSEDKGTTLSQWGGLVSHRTSPAAKQLIEWGWALLDLAWQSG
jgi:hypothetical protein